MASEKKVVCSIKTDVHALVQEARWYRLSRVFIFRTSKFPHGSASANYVMYLAKAIQMQGNEVIVIGTGKNRDIDNNQGRFFYDGIEYYNNEKENTIEEKLCYSRKFLVHASEKYRFSSEGYAVSYSPDILTLRFLLKTFGNGHVSVCRVENFQAIQYPLKFANPKFIVYKLGVHYLHSRVKKSIPISSYLQYIDEEHGCSTLLLPIMADTSGVNKKEREGSSEINYIYAGLKKTTLEDDLEQAFQAFDRLDKEKTSNVRIHFTGITRNEFESRYPQLRSMSSVYEKCVFHGWLEYDALTELYSKMHYLLLARKVNNITLANFPSKIPELMSYGVVPICTPIGDYTERYLRNGIDSYIAKDCTAESFSEVIEDSIRQHSNFKKMSSAAVELVQERFDYRNWSDALNKFILS